MRTCLLLAAAALVVNCCAPSSLCALKDGFGGHYQSLTSGLLLFVMCLAVISISQCGKGGKRKANGVNQTHRKCLKKRAAAAAAAAAAQRAADATAGAPDTASLDLQGAPSPSRPARQKSKFCSARHRKTAQRQRKRDAAASLADGDEKQKESRAGPHKKSRVSLDDGASSSSGFDAAYTGRADRIAETGSANSKGAVNGTAGTQHQHYSGFSHGGLAPQYLGGPNWPFNPSPALPPQQTYMHGMQGASMQSPPYFFPIQPHMGFVQVGNMPTILMVPTLGNPITFASPPSQQGMVAQPQLQHVQRERADQPNGSGQGQNIPHSKTSDIKKEV